MKTGEPTGNRRKILVVEDEPSIGLLLRNRLTAAGYAVENVDDGERALQAARLDPPDLLLLDIMLPRLDGYRICRLLKFDKRFQHIPIVIVSGRAGAGDLARSRELHADAYVEKPFDPAKLLQVIGGLLACPRPAPPADFPIPVWLDGTKPIRF